MQGAEKRRIFSVVVFPTEVRDVPQDSCQLPGRKGFSAIPELPNGTWFSQFWGLIPTES